MQSNDNSLDIYISFLDYVACATILSVG
jgi:hypothetical protein